METSRVPVEPVPNFICPTCGYFGATTWDSYETEELGPERLDFGCQELLGMILIDHLKGYPFQLACLHPDGTYGYAPEVAPGKRGPNPKGRIERREITPTEAEALLAASPPLHAIVGDAAIEQKIYRLLGGLLFATYNPLARIHPVIDFSERFATEWESLADMLYGVSDTSPLALHYASDDPNFTALQQEVLALIQAHYFLVVDPEFAWVLQQNHVLTPTQIREALAPGDEQDEDDG